jgi:Skp family chaperone for outer membrane proteins
MALVVSSAPTEAQIAPTNKPTVALAQQDRSIPQSFADLGKIAYVNLDRIASLSAEGKAAAATLQRFRDRKAGEVAERGKQVEALQAKLSQGESVLNDDARQRLRRQFDRAQIDFQRFTQDSEAEVQDLQQQLMSAFTAKLFPIIGQVATEKNLWAVFNLSESGIIWQNPAFDLSEEIARRLDASSKAK